MHSRTAKWALLAAAALATPGTAAALLASASAGHAADLTPQEQKLVAAAKREGAVTLINPLFSDITGQRLAEGFERIVLGHGRPQAAPTTLSGRSLPNTRW